MKDLYYILGQDINTTPGELNAAYRKLAQKLRPDGPETDLFLESHFSEIIEAYQVLSDPDKRRKYDAVLRKSQKRRLYWFKLSYLSVAAVITLIGFTALFGFYVMKIISGDKAKPFTVTKKETAEVVQPRHHKRKHKLILAIIAAPVAVNKPVVVLKAAVLKTDTTLAPSVKPVALQLHENKPVVTVKPVITNITVPAAKIVTVYLQANTTGIISLHQMANYQSAIITYIPNHSEVQVLEKGPSFCKVTFHDQTGYVPKWTVPE